MSSTTNPAASATSAPSRPARMATACFVLAVVAFLLAGIAIVVGQAIALAAGDAAAARGWADVLVPVAFGGSSVAGLLSFSLTYGRTEATGDAEAPAARD